ncbi:uncharacterized protein [Phyllobates terribilis]|uniref:uncharacterized protein n=1 Tax=Phyllobates terribilis TaxID=111132 RepID=UPI003CCAF70B
MDYQNGEVISGHLVVYQPLNAISVEVNTTAVIPCVSSEHTDNGLQIYWFQRKWIYNERPLLVKSCVIDNNTHKYICKYDKGFSELAISNSQHNDSGVYFCALNYVDHYIFGNGSYLNSGDKSTPKSSVHILALLQPPSTYSLLQLTCVVHEARDTVHITWNVSGRQHRGRTISKMESNGTWTIMNFISLPGDNWNNIEKVTCEVWLGSSPISVHWVITEKEEIHDCQIFLKPVAISGILLLLTFSVHLIRTFKLTGTKSEVPMDDDTVTKDEIVYTELNMKNLTKHRN